ncbi:plasmid replication family protein [Candidatus Phytoplasma oryzae]|uniref:Plasmid replication family protein n=1 Tax=Candidatus Phytoplasma oryzae TaxID=203274 RepID=A0A139JQ03_9MOLU|nr:Rep family protein [Candidatus Phytoplasma oryzae]KXT29039.1 plasmid replication family protein [Candidatus Phytoplasma oryzae]
MNPGFRLRRCEIVIKEDLIKKDFIDKVLKKKKIIKKFAYILHNRDVLEDGSLKNPHYHIVLVLKTPYDVEYIASWFKTSSNFVEKIKGNMSDILNYLTHKNDLSKFQYEDYEVVSNFNWKKTRDEGSIKKYRLDKRLKDLLTKIMNGEIKEYNISKKITVYENNIYATALERAFKFRTNFLKGVKRNMDCIFITGKSGSGKTTYAKYLADQKGYSIYVSSGSNDILDDYQSQECIILDDLRPECLGLSDLLKMLDNNTASTVKSRYKNKVLECNLMIITTTIPIKKFFDLVFYKKEKKETIVQLQRRCKVHIRMDKKNIYYSTFNSIKDCYEKEFVRENKILKEFKIKELNEQEQLEKIIEITGDKDIVDAISSDEKGKIKKIKPKSHHKPLKLEKHKLLRK